MHVYMLIMCISQRACTWLGLYNIGSITVDHDETIVYNWVYVYTVKIAKIYYTNITLRWSRFAFKLVF